MMKEMMDKAKNATKVMSSKMLKEAYKASKRFGEDSFYAATPKSSLTRKNDEYYRVYSLCEVANYLSKEKFVAMVREGFEILGDGSDIGFESSVITDENIRAFQIHAIRMNDIDETSSFLGRWNVTIKSHGNYEFYGNYYVDFRRIGGRCRCHVYMSVFNEDMNIDIEADSPYRMYAKLSDAVKKIEDQAEALAELKVKPKKVTAIVKKQRAKTPKKPVQRKAEISMDELEKECESVFDNDQNFLFK